MTEAETEIPENRCGFILKPNDVDFTGSIRDWTEQTSPVCCYRTVWKDHEETGRCIWHADIDQKSSQELANARAETPERLDGAILRNVTVNRQPQLFRGCGLIGATVDNSTFTYNKFIDADLRWIEFIDSKLTQTQFSEATLAQATFDDTILTQTILSDTNFSKATFHNTTFIQNTFVDANFTQATFSDADLSGEEFPDADFTRATFSDANLRQAKFPDADFTRATFSDANLRQAKFPDADFIQATFSDTDLTGAKSRDANFGGAKFPDADLSQAKFPEAKLVITKFPNADLSQARFPGANLREAKFPDADLRQAEFPEAILKRTKFPNTTLRQTEFREAKLQYAEFTDADAIEANFRHANLQDAVFTRTDCRKATFTSAQIYETIFSDTRINSITTFYDSSTHRPLCIYEQDSTKADHLPDDVYPLEAAQWVYRRLEILHEDNAFSDEARQFHISKEEAERKLYKKQFLGGDHRTWRALSVKTFMWYFTKHGESVARVLFWWGIVIGTAGVFLPFVGGVKDSAGVEYALPLSPRLLTELKTSAWGTEILMNLYFSITTFSTIMDGGLAPAGTGTRVVVAVESIIGALLVALLVFVLGRRTAR